jgi:hypothetical protein
MGCLFKIIAITCVCAIATAGAVFATEAAVSGFTKLDGESNHSGITVTFVRVAPSVLEYTATTDVAGEFTVVIETGVYEITYSSDGYFSRKLLDQFIYEETNVPAISLPRITTLIRVPSTLPTIQEAIGASADGDTVLVTPGRYMENINFLGKEILVASEYILTGERSIIRETVIDGGGTYRVVEFSNGEGNGAQLVGLTITNGFTDRNHAGESPGRGGGILCYRAYPIIRDLWIHNNEAESSGGGISILSNRHPDNPDILIDNVIIENNKAMYTAAIESGATPVCIQNSIISSNIAEYQGIITYYGGAFQILNSVIADNRADAGSIIKMSGSLSDGVTLQNCICSNNSGRLNVFIDNASEGPLNINNCCFYDNNDFYLLDFAPYFGDIVTENVNGDPCDVFGNIFLNPWFVNPAEGNYHLTTISPCIGAGTSDGAPTLDIVGKPYSDPPSMGAYRSPLLDPNQSPVIVTESLPDAIEGKEYSAQIEVDDPNVSDVHTYQILLGPPWLSIDEFGHLRGMPDDEDVGEDISVEIRVTDPYILYDTIVTVIRTIDVAHPPSIPDQALPDAIVGRDYIYNILFTDPDVREEHFFQIVDAPDWLIVTPESGMLHGIPEYNDAEIMVPITVKVTDPENLSALFSTHLNVIKEPPPPPVYVSYTHDIQDNSSMVKWGASPGEEFGSIIAYRIYRSRNPEPSNSSIPITAFVNDTDLFNAEQYSRIELGSVPAGTAQYHDANIHAADAFYYYWVQSVGLYGVSNLIRSSFDTHVNDITHAAFRVSEPYPNPANAAIALDVILPDDAPVYAAIYAITGQRVAVLHNGILGAGVHTLIWHSGEVSSGLYLVILDSAGLRVHRKIVVLK